MKEKDFPDPPLYNKNAKEMFWATITFSPKK